MDDVDEFVHTVGIKDEKRGSRYLRVGQLYCPLCGGLRRMDMSLKYRQSVGSGTPPVLAVLNCGECDTVFTALLYETADEENPGLAILPAINGGLTTPHTPEGVGYYLDQAQKSHSVGANSAAIAMFRGALEHLLYDQGFRNGMCGKKIADLEKAIADKTAPKWAYELDTEFLTVMKQLGDGSIHPNDGDIANQKGLDGGLIAQVRHTFEMLLFLVYELPLQKQERLTAMKAAVIKK